MTAPPEPLPSAPESSPQNPSAQEFAQKKPVKVLWLQVCALAGVQGSMTLTWVIYNLYLAQVLQQFGFGAGAVTTIVWVENLLAAAIEPLVGRAADLSQRWLGSRMPLVAVGTVLSAAVFVLIPILWVFASWGQAVQWFRPILPLVLVLWALAMTLLRTPALSLLERYALHRRLPQAASFLTVADGIGRAWGFLSSAWILHLGPVFAFGIGSTALLLGTIGLLLADPDVEVDRRRPPAPSPVSPRTAQSLAQAAPVPGQPIPAPPLPKPSSDGIVPIHWGNLGVLFATGLGLSIGCRLVLATFARVLQDMALPEVKSNVVLGILFLSTSIVAIPWGRLSIRLSLQRSLFLGLILLAGLSLLLPWVPTLGVAVLLAIGFGVVFCIVVTAALPFALTLVPTGSIGLGVGVYCSGEAIATTTIAIVFANLQNFHPLAGALLAAATFVLTAFFVSRGMMRPVKKTRSTDHTHD